MPTQESIFIAHSAAATALGSLQSTTEALFARHCALHTSAHFGPPLPLAFFADHSLHDPCVCIRTLAQQASFNPQQCENSVFIYAAAKGDLRALDSTELHNQANALLATQAQQCAAALAPAWQRIIAISQACASGLIALEYAHELLRAKRCSEVVIFGFDTLSRFVTSGFSALGALSAQPARPFDVKRDGLSLGEGAALAIVRRGTAQKGDIVVQGCGSSNDANHRTGPSRTGEGLHRAAHMALLEAGCEAEQIGGIKCHGTATRYNDAMEARAIELLCGASPPPCVSFKGALGHTSGGGALMELLLAAACLKRRQLPPTAGFEAADSDAPVPVSREPQPLRAPTILCLSAGFGGINAATLLREHV